MGQYHGLLGCNAVQEGKSRFVVLQPTQTFDSVPRAVFGPSRPLVEPFRLLSSPDRPKVGVQVQLC
jgi:hypothetical protein